MRDSAMEHSVCKGHCKMVRESLGDSGRDVKRKSTIGLI